MTKIMEPVRIIRRFPYLFPYHIVRMAPAKQPGSYVAVICPWRLGLGLLNVLMKDSFDMTAPKTPWSYPKRAKPVPAANVIHEVNVLPWTSRSHMVLLGSGTPEGSKMWNDSKSEMESDGVRRVYFTGIAVLGGCTYHGQEEARERRPFIYSRHSVLVTM